METKSGSVMQRATEATFKKNVSNVERVAMVTLGSYLLYKGSQNGKSVGKMATGAAFVIRGISGYCPVYDAVDHLKNDKASNVTIRLNSTINKPVHEVYAFWRELENLPKFMNHLESVKTLHSTLSEWTAKGPGGMGTISWKAEILKQDQNRLLSWQSLPESTIYNAGKVVFKPKGQATDLDITITYQAPFGIVGEAAAKLLNPYFEKLIREDVENFKTVMETQE